MHECYYQRAQGSNVFVFLKPAANKSCLLVCYGSRRRALRCVAALGVVQDGVLRRHRGRGNISGVIRADPLCSD